MRKMIIAFISIAVVLVMMPLIVSANEAKWRMIYEDATIMGVTIKHFASPKGEVAISYSIKGTPVYEEWIKGGERQAFIRTDCCHWLKGEPLWVSLEENKLVFSLCIGKEIKRFEFSLAY
jgi:hypothetical protein